MVSGVNQNWGVLDIGFSSCTAPTTAHVWVFGFKSQGSGYAKGCLTVWGHHPSNTARFWGSGFSFGLNTPGEAGCAWGFLTINWVGHVLWLIYKMSNYLNESPYILRVIVKTSGVWDAKKKNQGCIHEQANHRLKELTVWTIYYMGTESVWLKQMVVLVLSWWGGWPDAIECWYLTQNTKCKAMAWLWVTHDLAEVDPVGKNLWVCQLMDPGSLMLADPCDPV